MISWSMESYPGSPVPSASAALCAVTCHCSSYRFICFREPTGFGEPDSSSDGEITGKETQTDYSNE